MVGCHLLQHSVVVMRLFCFVFFNKWATVTESRLLSVFLSYRKKIQRLKRKKKKERVKKMQIEKD